MIAPCRCHRSQPYRNEWGRREKALQKSGEGEGARQGPEGTYPSAVAEQVGG